MHDKQSTLDLGLEVWLKLTHDVRVLGDGCFERVPFVLALAQQDVVHDGKVVDALVLQVELEVVLGALRDHQIEVGVEQLVQARLCLPHAAQLAQSAGRVEHALVRFELVDHSRVVVLECVSELAEVGGLRNLGELQHGDQAGLEGRHD